MDFFESSELTEDPIERAVSAGALIATWCGICLSGFHVLGIMGMFLGTFDGGWRSVFAWMGVLTVVASTFIPSHTMRLHVRLAGATVLLLLALGAALDGLIVSVLVTGWPFVLLWVRLLKRVSEPDPRPAWKLAAEPDDEAQDVGTPGGR